MAEAEEIKADLNDPAKKDNQRMANLFDDAKWREVIKEYNDGKGKPLPDLIQDMLERR